MSFWNEVSHRHAAQLFQRLATGYRAGLDLRTLWDREAQAPRPVLAHRARQVVQGLASGDTLAESMEHTAGFFSALTIAVVRAGEVSGRLEQSFAKLAKYHEDWRRFYSSVLHRLAWPLFELAFSLFVIGALILLMGWALSSSNHPPIDWLGFGWSTQTYFRAYLAAIVGGVGLVVGFIVALKAGVFGDWPLLLLLRLPVIGGVLRHTALARLTWALGAALGAGMDVQESVRLAFRAGAYPPANRKLEQILADLARGEPIHESFQRAGCFPEEFQQLVSTGEISGELPETLERLSGYYQERVDAGMQLLATICFVACFLFVAILITATIIYLFNTLVLNVYREFAV